MSNVNFPIRGLYVLLQNFLHMYSKFHNFSAIYENKQQLYKRIPRNRRVMFTYE